MKILVFSGFEAGSHYAHAINTIKMAEGFALLGHDVTVMCKNGAKALQEKELNEIYGIEAAIQWIPLPRRKMFFFRMGEHWDLALAALPKLLKLKPDVVFARNYIFPCLTSVMGFSTVAESHAHVGNRTRNFLRMIKATRRKCFRSLVTISNVLADYYISLGAPREKIVVLSDAVDLKLFSPSAGETNQNPYLKFNGPNIVYSGHLYDYKGIPVILETARNLTGMNFHFIGGTPEDLSRQKIKAESMGLKNVFFHGHRNHSDVPPYLWFADVLLLVPSNNHPSARWTSPVKMGEYLASKKPVIASDIPALRDNLTDKEVLFVEPDSAGALKQGIEKLIGDVPFSKQLVETGFLKAKSISYIVRAKKVLTAMREGII